MPLLLMVGGVMEGSPFRPGEFPGLLLLYGIPPLLIGTMTWMLVAIVGWARVNMAFFVINGAFGGVLTALFLQLLSLPAHGFYLTFSISGALSALTFYEVAVKER
jgi:hypothetical protein